MSLRSGSSSPWLPSLMALVVALLAWTLGDELRGRLPGVEQQIRTVSKLGDRDPGSQLAAAQREARQARAERAAIEQRLQTGESAQVSRARLGQELRRLCAASGAQSCAVRLSDLSSTASTTTPTPAATPDPVGAAPGVQAAPNALRESVGAKNLESLGLGKGRAVVSGIFNGKELTDFVTTLARDPVVTWRVNGVLVRGNAFEVDVERHLLPGPKARLPNP